MTVYAAPDAFIKPVDGGLASLSCTLEGIKCGGCTNQIERHLSQIGGVQLARANATTRRLKLVWDPEQVATETLLNAVADLGFRAHPFAEDSSEPVEESLLVRLAVAGFGTMNIMAFSFAVWAGLASDMGEGTRAYLHWISAGIAIPVSIYAGSAFYLPAAKALRAGRMTMDTPITLAIATTLAASLFETLRGGAHVYFDAAVSLIFFLLLGRLLDQMLRRRSSAASENLRALGRGSAQRINSAGVIEHVQADELVVGDFILVPPGARIPADGALESTYAEIDESIVSGETLPRSKHRGDHIIAGGIVTAQPAKIRVSAVGANARIGAIAGLLETAEAHKGRDQRLADRFAQAYGPVVVGAASAGFLVWHLMLGANLLDSLMISAAVLVVTCPCAAGLATPAVVVRAVNHLMARGIIVKSGDALERLAEINVVALDKTGTLSTARLELHQNIEPGNLESIATIAVNSTHPLAQALSRACPKAQALDGVVEHVGQGLIAPNGSRLGSAAFVGADTTTEPLGPELWYRPPHEDAVRLTFQDSPKADAHELIGGLHARGLETILLSGDKAIVVEPFARRVGTSRWLAEMQPEQKVGWLQERQKSGRQVLMIGDGMNDAPSLGAAYVSVAPVSAAQISQSAADMVLSSGRLTPVLDAIDIARKAHRLITQNLIFAALYNVVTLPLALAGGLTPLVAAILMSSSSLLVMVNAMRLRPNA